MKKKKSLGLFPKLIIGIVLGIIAGKLFPANILGILVTITSLFGNFLNFVVPLIIVGFVVPGIADLGKGAGKLLGFTVILAYASTVIDGVIAYGASSTILPKIIDFGKHVTSSNLEENLLEPFFEIAMPPLFDIMSAILIAFVLGIGIAAIKNKTMYDFFNGFQDIVKLVVEKTIIPFLPVYIAGIFANMTYAGKIVEILSVYGRVFLLVLIVQWVVVLMEYFIASTYSGEITIGQFIKNQIPAYFTAIGTQSSAATIPVNLEVAKANGVSKQIREFVIPLCGTIHLSGSSVALTIYASAVMMMSSMPISFPRMLGFILMMGITLVAAPGVPGGAVMAALGLLQSMLGFSEAQLGLMIALYIAQDSFGTACCVCGDNAIAVMVNKKAKKMKLDVSEGEI